MDKAALTRGVAVVTLVAKVYEGKCITSYGTRIGFCGTFNKQILSELTRHFKKLYEVQIKAYYKNADKITCRATIKTMECDMFLNGGE